MESLEAIRIAFFEECDEGLVTLDAALRAFARGDRDPQTLAAAIGAVRAIKGGAGAFGMEPLVRFGHAFETLLGRLAAGRLPWTTELARTVLGGAQVLANQIRIMRAAPADVSDPPALPRLEPEADAPARDPTPSHSGPHGDVRGLIARVRGFAVSQIARG